MTAKIEDLLSLKIGSEKLRNCIELSVPAIAQPLLKIRPVADKKPPISNSERSQWQRGASIPGAVGPLIRTRVLCNKRLSRPGSATIRKAKWLLELESLEGDQQRVKEVLANCDAGDSFNVLFENPRVEVDFVLARLSQTADEENELGLVLDTKPELNGKFAHFPKSCSPRQLLSQFIDIRRAPSRLCLRVLADHASNPIEQRRLLELASVQGATEFTRFVRQPNISLAELLCEFPSLSPPLECIVEHLPRLLPRHYTLSSYLPSSSSNSLRFRFVYSVLDLPSSILEGRPEFQGIRRFGACTQWLLERRPGDEVQLIQKEASKFRLLPPSIASAMPDIAAEHRRLLHTPLVMVGPGTGVAPFVAFLQKIKHLLDLYDDDELRRECKKVKRVLIYASSNLEDEYLFRSELEQMMADGVLSDLVACESRPSSAHTTPRPARIYDALRARATEIAQILEDNDDEERPKGLFYACGDVKNMSRELWICLREILQSQKGFSSSEAIERLKRMRDQERLIEDVWS